MIRIRFIIISLIIASSIFSQEDSVRLDYRVEKPDSTLLSNVLFEPPKQYSLLKSVGFSLLIPGAGQFYCKRRVRGGAFLLAESIVFGFAAHRYFERYAPSQKEYLDSIPKSFDKIAKWNNFRLLNDSNNELADSLYQKVDSFYELQYGTRRHRTSFYHFMGWGIGLYITNILDALESSKNFYNNDHKKPGVAAALSAIPGLGLGQLYNGSYQKTGLLLTTHTMLLLMARNKNKLAQYCNNKRLFVKNTINATDSLNFSLNETYVTNWKKRYDSNIRDRNMYLWYFVLFYFYGIFDAAVDAHLHDKRQRIQLSPMADPVNKKVSMNLSLGIKSRRKKWQ